MKIFEKYKSDDICNAPKKILILGNGFDLAHGLLTRYADFLEFCEIVMTDPFKYERIEKWLSKYIADAHTIRECIENIDLIGEFMVLIEGNIWYEYLCQQYDNSSIKGENWIDFESEISFVIETIDKHVRNLSHNWYYLKEEIGDDIDFPAKFEAFRIIVDNTFDKKFETVKNVRTRMYDDLNDIIMALEIYLSEFVEKLIKPNKLNLIDEIAPDYIINFNYTHTYQNVYGGDVKPFHIHGELNHKPNNMVLGIDEYWSKKERDRHTNFTIFKKFAQRIQKRTGRDYFEIYNKLKQSDEQVKVYFFGHSLDVTDKDVLKMFLKDDSFEVTIYCLNEEVKGEYIANIIGIIGEKKLIYKVNQETARLEFKLINEEKEISTSGAAT